MAIRGLDQCDELNKELKLESPLGYNKIPHFMKMERKYLNEYNKKDKKEAAVNA